MKKAANKRDPPVQEIVIASSSEDEVGTAAVAGPSKVAGKKAAGRADATTNGKAKVPISKGKGKAEPPPKAARSSALVEQPMEVDEGQVIEIDRDEAAAPRTNRARANAKPPKTNGAATRHATDDEGHKKQLQDARAQLDNVISERDKLSKQLEELFLIRHTEPEEVLEQQTAVYEAQLKTQETLINELTTQLSKVKALARTDKSYMLHFLTREDADEEKDALEKEVARWQDIVKQKDAVIVDKNKQITELETREKILQSDLQAEIQRGKTLASRNPALPVGRAPVKPAEDPANGRVVRLYEDMTNFLITGAKIEKSQYFDLDETVFTCIYTHKDNRLDSGGVSLNFTLRESWITPETMDSELQIMSKDQLVSQIKYEPLNLDKEPPEFVKNLDFFKDPFMFSTDQMTVFLKTLTDRLGSMQSSEDEAEEDEIVVLD
ncbi:hypothetical protein B0H21DRAFT_724014 [Amylocystis lapponica]|nr:hypothetical protein B0H21DRAFT_724014 [Amylocystis lapponica]